MRLQLLTERLEYSIERSKALREREERITRENAERDKRIVN